MFSWNGSDCLNMEIMDEDSFVRDGMYVWCCLLLAHIIGSWCVVMLLARRNPWVLQY